MRPLPPLTTNPNGKDGLNALKVIPVAHTLIEWPKLMQVIRGTKFGDAVDECDVTDADHLAEFAGRSCYKAYDRKRPETATTEGYLNNILSQGHYSVLEHSSVTFYVTGVSRSLLTELERHRFLSFSVESQRYVDQAASHPLPVIPPSFNKLPATGPWLKLDEHYGNSLNLYEDTVRDALRAGLTIKEAREAARAFLPNATPVDMVVTGNLRCWRDVIAKRYHVTADAEIQLFATEILSHLRELAPFSVSDIPLSPYA